MSRQAPPLAAAASHPGRVRSGNEDLFLLEPSAGIFAVIDGVGGEEGGEEAARIAAAILKGRLSHPTASAEQRLREAITLANNEIVTRARATTAWSRMSCVLTAVVVEGERFTAGHVGDTRLYLLTPTGIRQLTRDHSPVGEMERRGELSELEAMRHPRKSEIFRDVGSEPHQLDDRDFVDIVEAALPPGSALLLATDGLTDQVAKAKILATVLAHAGTPERAVAALIDAANEAGGKDNVTVVLVETEGFSRQRTPRSPRPAVSRPAASRPAAEWPAAARAVVPRRRGVARPLLALAGLLAAAALGFSLPSLLERLDGAPPVRLEAPRVLGVGAGQAYATIGAALAAARPGDTVRVEPGTYAEVLELPSGVRVLSRLSRQAVIRLPAPEAGPEPGPGPPPELGPGPQRRVAVRAAGGRDTTLAGFRILGDAASPLDVGVLAVDAALLLEDLEIAGARAAALDISGSEAATVRGCLLRDNPGGALRLAGAATPRIEGNLFRDNGGNAGTGAAAAPVVRVADDAFPRFDGNDFEGNPGLPIRGLAPEAVTETYARNRFGDLPPGLAIEPRAPGGAP